LCGNGLANRNIMLTDIPGSFLHADIEQDVHILLEGTIAELIVWLEPRQYWKFISKYKKENHVVHQAEKAIIWDITGCALIYEITIRHFNWMEIKTEPCKSK